VCGVNLGSSIKISSFQAHGFVSLVPINKEVQTIEEDWFITYELPLILQNSGTGATGCSHCSDPEFYYSGRMVSG
jgi:hypothetical protein